MGSFGYLCGTKQAWETKPEARKAAKAMNHKRGGGVSAYRCPWCERYHVGVQNGRMR